MFPTPAAVHLAVAALATIAAGIATREPRIVAFGVALLLGTEMARGIANLGVARLRTAGLEMSWRTSVRALRATRGQKLVVTAEILNRDTKPAFFFGLRAIASSSLSIGVEPLAGVVPAGGSRQVRITVVPKRIGHHGIHGLTLEIVPQPGLFQAALAFGNPLGIEVLPAALENWLSSARGGRARHMAPPGASASDRPGEGVEIRELRDYVPGDPMKRIAWKASGKRGRLISRQLEHDEREVVWLVLDASPDLWGGADGTAPLDAAIDELATTARRHLGQGNRVGLAVAGGRSRDVVEPASGPAHAIRLAQVLLQATATTDADRSELDEIDVSRRAAEHAAMLDPRAATGLDPHDFDKVAAVIEPFFARAPFVLPAPAAPSARERRLRQYLACFGITSPARTDENRDKAEDAIARHLDRIAGERERPSSVVVLAPCRERPGASLAKAIARLRRRGVDVLWRAVELERPLGTDRAIAARTAPIVHALRRRARLLRVRGERHLRRLGARVVYPARTGSS